MREATTRRALLVGLASSLAAGSARATPIPATIQIDQAHAPIAELEAANGGRLGVAILDTASGVSFRHRADERFPMCSTFKLLACAAVLARVDAGQDQLDRSVAYAPADLLGYAPVTKAHVGDGNMTLGDLCAAAIDWSDNTAANLILGAIGGPTGWTTYVRSLGDAVSRLDRTEPTLNTALPDDPRDTTTPLAMTGNLHQVLIGNALTPASRAQLLDWLINDKVGDKRLRAGVPKSWRVGDKTGTGDYATANTIGILSPPDRAPILAAVYFTGSAASIDTQNAVHKAIGVMIADLFGG